MSEELNYMANGFYDYIVDIDSGNDTYHVKISAIEYVFINKNSSGIVQNGKVRLYDGQNIQISDPDQALEILNKYHEFINYTGGWDALYKDIYKVKIFYHKLGEDNTISIENTINAWLDTLEDPRQVRYVQTDPIGSGGKKHVLTTVWYLDREELQSEEPPHLP